jgi:hypothetical protein
MEKRIFRGDFMSIQPMIVSMIGFLGALAFIFVLAVFMPGNGPWAGWLFGALVIGVPLAALVALNLWHWKRRAVMTQEERTLDDAAHAHNPGDW